MTCPLRGNCSASVTTTDQQQSFARLAASARVSDHDVPVARQLLGLLCGDPTRTELVERHVRGKQLVDRVARHAHGVHPTSDRLPEREVWPEPWPGRGPVGGEQQRLALRLHSPEEACDSPFPVPARLSYYASRRYMAWSAAST